MRYTQSALFIGEVSDEDDTWLLGRDVKRLCRAGTSGDVSAPISRTFARRLRWTSSSMRWPGAARPPANSDDGSIEEQHDQRDQSQLGPALATDNSQYPIGWTIAPGSYYLLERIDNNTVGDIPADQLLRANW
jgi:hypothetical protein